MRDSSIDLYVATHGIGFLHEKMSSGVAKGRNTLSEPYLQGEEFIVVP